MLVLADAGNWKVGVPGLTYSLRGLAAVDMRVRALDGPVHCGMAGGLVPDPILALARMLASLVDERGDPAFDGCWDDYEPPGDAERDRLDALPDNLDRLRADRGNPPRRRARGRSRHAVFERLWLRPAITVIGIDGHPIKGSSNQIIAEAAARISVRVGRGQDPDRLNDALARAPRAARPLGLELTVTPIEAVAAWETRSHGSGVRRGATRAAHRFRRRPGAHGRRRVDPVRGTVRRRVRRHPRAPARTGRPDSRIHGEDESLHLGDWRTLIRSEIHLLAELAANDTGAGEGAGSLAQ